MREEILYAIIFTVAFLIGFILGQLNRRKSDGTIYIQNGDDEREQVIWDLSSISEEDLLKRKQLVITVQNNLSKK